MGADGLPAAAEEGCVVGQKFLCFLFPGLIHDAGFQKGVDTTIHSGEDVVCVINPLQRAQVLALRGGIRFRIFIQGH